MNKIQLDGCAAVQPNGVSERVSVLIEDGMIRSIGDGGDASARVIEMPGMTLYPGFIDIHNHGAVGVDVNQATAESLRDVGEFLASNGVTGWLPTFVPDSDENYRRVIAEIERFVGLQDEVPAARILGVHYEGVFANRQMCGALRPEYFKTFSGSELAELPRLSDGAHLTTFAPEIEGGVELARALAANGWIPSIGHTSADFGTLEDAYEAGARHVTHFFNAMTGLHHREIGVVGWALGKHGVSCDIIADGIHVAPQVLRLAYEVKTSDKLMLISDSVAPTGLGDGTYELWEENVSVTAGRTRNERGSIAGSVITMLDAVRMYLSLGVAPHEAARMASLNPARLLGIERSQGSIEIGKRADVVALDGEGNVRLCLVGGQVAFENL